MIRALVTGGSGDIGAAIALRLAAQGLQVIVHTHRNPDRGALIRDAIVSAGGCAEVVCFDLTDAKATRAVLEASLAQGPIQVLVNNAGIHMDAPMAGMTESQWHDVVDLSLHGFFNVTQPLLLPMLRTRWGRIVNISSVAAVMGNRGQTNYAAAKAGLHGATRALARELASRGVTVNVVAPGIIAGRAAAASFDAARIRALVPMQRAGRPEEVAALVAFLTSEEAGYISGQIISINGAMA
jgi:3-oxoacyl-[acyl-carrier protein] reductase